MAHEAGIEFEGYGDVRPQESRLPWSVYSATDRRSGRPVRLSVLHAPQHMSVERRRSILDWFAEAGFQAQRLSSSVVPPVLAYRSDPDAAWIASEPARGRTLREVISEDGPFRTERAMAVSGRIASALAAAHSAGWAHGWLNGDSVWLDEGDAVTVTDLGLGLAVSPITGGLQQPFPARPGFLATDPRRLDLQCLGLLTTWMLAGRLPDPVGVPRSESFPKGVPPNVVREIRALIDSSLEHLTAADWLVFAGVDGGTETTAGGLPFYETGRPSGRGVPRWVLGLVTVGIVALLVWGGLRLFRPPAEALTLPPPGATAPSTTSAPPRGDLTLVQVGPLSPDTEQAMVDRLTRLRYPVYVRRQGEGAFVQVGAFANPDAAERLRAELQAAGFPVRIGQGGRSADTTP
jgi:hypothetical protein